MSKVFLNIVKLTDQETEVEAIFFRGGGLWPNGQHVFFCQLSHSVNLLTFVMCRPFTILNLV